jgi:hypothetical protein
MIVRQNYRFSPCSQGGVGGARPPGRRAARTGELTPAAAPSLIAVIGGASPEEP